MDSESSQDVLYRGVNLSHDRLTELLKLADAARPFYTWVEAEAQSMTGAGEDLSQLLERMSEPEIAQLILRCHAAEDTPRRPALFDGIGRQYKHDRAVYYFFSWLARDAPQQRLQPILARAQPGARGLDRLRVQAEALAKLIVAYREQLGGFEWTAVREVIVDRLEGSRRASKGREAEVVVRTALSAALQAAFDDLGGYGRFASIHVADKEVRVLGETFDVSVEFRDAAGRTQERLLIPVKTRETQGGGHAYLFTRDIDGAMNEVRRAAQADTGGDIRYWLAAFIIAESWAQAEAEHVDDVCDFAVTLRLSPTRFSTLDESHQAALDAFIRSLLDGELEPKAHA